MLWNMSLQIFNMSTACIQGLHIKHGKQGRQAPNKQLSEEQVADLVAQHAAAAGNLTPNALFIELLPRVNNHIEMMIKVLAEPGTPPPTAPEDDSTTG